MIPQGPTFGTITKVIEENSLDTDKKLNWSVVRVLGELQVLSRASYAMLVLVPIIAALWSSIRNYSLLINDSIEVMIARLTVLSDTLTIDERISNLANDLSADAVSNLEGITALTETITDSVATDAALSSSLPLIWILSFFAALAAVFAQLIYQASVPAVVRGASKREFISEIIEEESKLRSSDTALKSEEVEELIVKLNSQYTDAANSRTIACAYSMFFYGISIILIIWILGIQTYAVIGAGGYI